MSQQTFTGASKAKDALLEAIQPNDTELFALAEASQAEVAAARDGEASLLAKEKAQDAAIAAATAGSGVLVSATDILLGYLSSKTEFDATDFVTETLNPGADEVLKVSLAPETPGEDTQELGSLTGAITISAITGAKVIGMVDLTVTGDITFTFTSVVAVGKTDIIIMRMVNPGAFTFTWPTEIEWDNETEPAWVEAGKDGAAFIRDATGGKWRGFRWWMGVA